MLRTILKTSILFSIILFSFLSADAAAVVDRAFGTNGIVTTAIGAQAQATAMKIQPDGKILVLGSVGTGSAQDTVLVRYNPNGSLDATFGTGGKVVTAFSPAAETANELALQADGKILVAGNFFSTATQSVDFLVARFNANGLLDSSFGSGGIVGINQGSTDIFHAIVVQPDGRIIAVGRTSDDDQAMAVRLLPNGAPDTSFANGGLFYFRVSPTSQNNRFLAAALYSNGRIIIGGRGSDTLSTAFLILLEPGGALAQGFGSNGYVAEFSTGTGGLSFDLQVLPDGKVLSMSGLSLRRLLPDGTPDPAFRILYASAGQDTAQPGTDFAVRSDGKILVLNQARGSLNFPYTIVYNPDGRDINRVRDLSGSDIAVQSNDKFVIADASGNDFILKRFVAITSPGTRIADFDFDEKTDLLVYRYGNIVYALRSRDSISSYRINLTSEQYPRIVPEDFYTDDPTRFPLYYWSFSLQSAPAYFNSVTENGNTTGVSNFQWGVAGDLPVGGDYNGETRWFNSLYIKPSELAVFRPSTGTWWIYNRFNGTYFAIQWGANGDKPVPADYDYDGITDTAIYRPSTGEWWIRRSSDGSGYAIRFGLATDIPLTGDFDGDGRADLTVYRPSEGNWYQLLTTEGFKVTRFGLSTDVPAPGDYDGDGKHDVAVFREGVWYLLQSTEGFKAVQWGSPGDDAVTVRYDR